ncbi:MAG: hypothetical protein M3Z28_11925 [Candidatus Dormibacteraeota bacterium]|nr:hypothetical protein [Candidatus Dormibacteraeota bacterium]
MTRWWLAGLLACAAVLSSALSGAAQGPIRSETRYAGGYVLRIDFYSDPPFTGRRLVFDVVVSSITGDRLRGVTVAAAAIPDAATNGTATLANISPGAQSVGGFQGYVTMAVRGDWRLRFTVSGPAGTNAADVPLHVTAPTAIPVSLAWLIGLAPLIALIGFGVRQRSYLARLQIMVPTEADGASGPAAT